VGAGSSCHDEKQQTKAMRSETEMMSLILDFISTDDNIRGAYMNGSRANPNIPNDEYQDYDVVFACHEIQQYLDDHTWIDHFGKVAILQEADKSDTLLYGLSPRPDSYIFLILYLDDVRTDLCFKTIDQALKEYGSDSATVLLVDKDHRFKALEEASDKDYWIQKPSAFMVGGAINEFYWCMQNVAKSLARDQVPYALWMMNGPIRDMLNKMIEWKIAKDHDYQVSTGKCGKLFKHYLSFDLYRQWESTVCGADIDEIWQSAFSMIALFSSLAQEVCMALGLSAHHEEEVNVTAHLKRIHDKTRSG
jgi:aminoglycoside 6-adenylyltransferase